jgi:hypothetical protein
MTFPFTSSGAAVGIAARDSRSTNNNNNNDDDDDGRAKRRRNNRNTRGLSNRARPAAKPTSFWGFSSVGSHRKKAKKDLKLTLTLTLTLKFLHRPSVFSSMTT